MNVAAGPLPNIPDAWSDAALDTARQLGDEPVDALAGDVLSRQLQVDPLSRLGYNQLLDLADWLLEEPELYLVRGSSLRQRFDAGDAALQDFFDPQPVPSWVDEAQLARAGQIWDDHALAITGVLYAACLPSCYLMGTGIPALYGTHRLGEHRFIFQRIYETGLMLDASMRSDGLRIVRDQPPHQMGDDLIAECQRRQPYAGWHWQGDCLHSQPGSGRVDQASVATSVRAVGAQAPRWIWGPGVVSARKVRFLHAAMRHYLLNPRSPEEGPPLRSGDALSQGQGTLYDRKRLGVPINQEDMAFTLLTFGYLIPVGLDKWGIVLDRGEREAFWHRWRLIGHLMGVRDELMPKDHGSAAILYQRILMRHKEATDMGRILTDSLLAFFGDYLPPQLRPHLPALLIREQLGADADLLLRASHPPPWWMLMCYRWVAMPSLRIVNRLRRSALRFLPLGIGWIGTILHQASQALIASWRDAYDRKPFYVPDSASGGWLRQQGADTAYLKTLQSWRSRLFLSVVSGLAGLITGLVLLVASIPLWFLLPNVGLIIDQVAGLAIGGGVLILALYVPHIAGLRPRRSEQTGSLQHAEHPLARRPGPPGLGR